MAKKKAASLKIVKKAPVSEKAVKKAPAVKKAAQRKAPTRKTRSTASIAKDWEDQRKATIAAIKFHPLLLAVVKQIKSSDSPWWKKAKIMEESGSLDLSVGLTDIIVRFTVSGDYVEAVIDTGSLEEELLSDFGIENVCSSGL